MTKYITKKDDSLWSIAKKFNINLVTLKKINNIKGDKIIPGIELTIPVKSSG